MPVPEPDPNEALRQRSNRVSLMDPIVALFYDLLMSHIAPGKLEELVRTACKHSDQVLDYSNGWLALYAQDLVRRLDKARETGAEETTVPPGQARVQTDG